jgi:hypothetical protein
MSRGHVDIEKMAAESDESAAEVALVRPAVVIQIDADEAVAIRVCGIDVTDIENAVVVAVAEIGAQQILAVVNPVLIVVWIRGGGHKPLGPFALSLRKRRPRRAAQQDRSPRRLRMWALAAPASLGRNGEWRAGEAIQSHPVCTGT